MADDKLGKLMAAVETDAKMVAVASAFDLSSVSSISGLEVWSQHLDPVGQGSHSQVGLSHKLRLKEVQLEQLSITLNTRYPWNM